MVDKNRYHTERDYIALFFICDAMIDPSYIKEDYAYPVATVFIPPKENFGTVHFVDQPKIPGYYRARYFVDGSLCTVGEPMEFLAHFVKGSLQSPSSVVCGLTYDVSYELEYTKMDKNKPNDGAFIGLYELGVRNPDDSLVSIPLEKTCTGKVTVHNLPKFPGKYELKLYLKNYNNQLIATSPIFNATIPLPKINKYQRMLQRCLRIYINTSLEYFIYYFLFI